ncbi:hypothetical protein KI809_09915 [Geobacter pelophilus]|uniref:Uncharacterized protein n=1 Tax=Geoanaerobacter pelophilus TaxID=60036 RepID=A0AAW4L6F2_9BACT|nr:hypothetical protein [Geoanaerobacter pelophilus]MBT0664613.1 hypothetical protein [Geoanaerobacter pelophilus]
MLAVHNWGKDKPYIIRIFAAHLVSTVQDMSDDFHSIKLRRFASQKFPMPRLKYWFALYRSHKKNIQLVKDIWSAVYGKNIIQSFSELLKELSNQKNQSKHKRPNPPSPEEIEQAKNLLDMVLTASEKDLEDEFNQLPLKQAVKRRMSKLLTESPLELAFYLFVAVPCWALYRTSPTYLYRRARQGDFSALENLLRLDQLMLHDPMIGKQIIAYRFNHSSSKYRKLLTAATSPPKGHNSRKNILLSQVGLISTLSHLTEKPLTPQDLFELIEAFDFDSKGKLFEDLPKTPDALARALSPDRNLWRNVFVSDN